ncbi:MAG: phospholipid carrier-dependent glycosyltransferase [Candidatus Pacebacteria bacterium]|jgi:4-amino-4-deoxy-L-arabinose transferase-like glycosyltransferase|nr:phospholipid carrier-dependent glycosyltransferase [Candidatus Paceibacterota bacterium]MBT4004575.1 phospholipid carrier-dependent glycosyltransferase [Candidatus Paceibacterota bacterium]MBT4359177.1 phospholipid carrier-dependent glycosyltransferase [Candidatus Paceibacterota bacterium]MBT4681063.1 phospholipid carrier-dependent glycosyltransferase [Candidatus Paceibacterota bacterium]MBT6898427.1 phospholipid carrier-dependent glycosyltransferase [Candidatus Paceibacterota bacterium]
MSFFKRYSSFLLLVLVLFSFAIRFLWLDRSPRGLLIDEAHFGYISYSLLETGMDEHGISWPVIFKGFGDQKLPVQAYLLMPFIKLIGLNSVGVRLPSVIFGSLLVAAIYWLLREFKIKEELSLFGSLIVALSPWTFMMSRFAYEANLALLFFTLSLVFLHKVARGKSSWWGVASASLMALTWYTYIAFRPVTLLFSVAVLLFLFVSKKIKWQRVAVFGVVLVALVTPLFHPQLAASGAARFNQVGILADEGVVMAINQNRTFCDAKLPRLLCYGLWNKPLYISKTLVKRFVATYSPQFLFTTGDVQNRYQSVENFGQFYLILLPLLFLGVVGTLFKVDAQKTLNNDRLFILLGLLIAPIPSILSGEPQMVRLSPLLPFLVLLITLGVQVGWQFLATRNWQRIIGGGLTAAVILSSLPFLISFYTIHTVKYDEAYQSYLPKLFETIDSYPDEVSIYVRPFFSDPIMAYAYYRQISPSHYQENVILGKKEDSGFQHAVGLDNLIVSEEPMLNIGCRAVKENKAAYFVTNEDFKRPPIPYLYQAVSENGAMNYAYVYDTVAYASKHPELCLD